MTSAGLFAKTPISAQRALVVAASQEYIPLVSIAYSGGNTIMQEFGTAKLFKHGRSQAVRLPKEFRMPGTEVRVRRLGRGVVLEPIEPDLRSIQSVFEEIDRLVGADFLPEGRPDQPPMPPAYAVFDE